MRCKMLPFLKPKQIGQVVVIKAKDDGELEPIKEEAQHPPELIDAAEDLIKAVSSKDASAVADAIYAAFLVCDASPHVEGPHIEED